MEEKPDRWKSVEELEEAFGRGDMEADEFTYEKRELKTRELRNKLSRGEISRGEFLQEQLRAGIEKLVVHGDYLFQEDGSVELKLRPDLDAMAGIYLMDLAGINYSAVEFQHKGDWVPGAIHIDTGQRKELTVEDDGSIFFDHHGQEKGEFTSATQITYETLVKLGFLKREEWLDRFSAFVSEIDNLSYPLDEKFFRGAWSNTLYGVQKILPVSVVAEFFKKGKNPREPFTIEEATKTAVRVRGGDGKFKEGTLLEACNSTSQKVKMSMANIEKAAEKMVKLGVRLETPDLGKVLLQAVEKGKKNKIPMGFTAAKALGYDTYVLWNEDQKSFFMSSQTRDIAKIYERIKDKIPTAKLIRGTMLLSPPTAEMGDLTREKFLSALGLKEYDDKMSGITSGKEEQAAVQPPEKQGVLVYIETLEEHFGGGTLELEDFNKKRDAIRRISKEDDQRGALDEAFGEGIFKLNEYNDLKELLKDREKLGEKKESGLAGILENLKKALESSKNLSREEKEKFQKLMEESVQAAFPEIAERLRRPGVSEVKLLSRDIIDIIVGKAEQLAEESFPEIHKLIREHPDTFTAFKKEFMEAALEPKEEERNRKFADAFVKLGVVGGAVEEFKQAIAAGELLARELGAKSTLTEEEKKEAAEKIEALRTQTGSKWERAGEFGGMAGFIILLGLLITLIMVLAVVEYAFAGKRGKK